MNKKIHTQNIIRVGNSLAITLNKAFVDAYKLKAKQQVYILYTQYPPRIIVKPDFSQGPSLTQSDIEKLPKEFRNWVKKFLKEDREALKALALL